MFVQSHNKVAYIMAKDLIRKTSNAIEPYIQAVSDKSHLSAVHVLVFAVFISMLYFHAYKAN